MTKLDIATSAPVAQGNPVNGYGRKEKSHHALEGKCEELQGHIFDMRGALAIFTLSITMRELA